MPVNSFENYYMSFQPNREELRSPYVKSLEERLEQDILCGILKPHTKLPPQRELADWLDLSLQTVTQAYAACEEKELIYGIMGKGTFVSPSSIANLSSSSMHSKRTAINMGGVVTFPSTIPKIAEKLKSIFHSLDYEKLLLPISDDDVRESQMQIIHWLNYFGMPSEGRMLSTAYGAQNALAIILTSLFEPGDCILTDSYTYPFFKQLAINLRIRLIPIRYDEDGILPQDIEIACQRFHPKGIYLIPTCHNPLGYCIPLHRRKEIAELAQRYDLIVIEDDASRFSLDASITPISSLLPDHGIYISGISNFYSGNLKLAYTAVPERLSNKLFLGFLSTNLSLAPPIQSILTKHLTQGELLLELSAEKHSIAVRRNLAFDSRFKNHSNHTAMPGTFRWIPLPSQFSCMEGSEFESLAEQNGIIVYHSDRFAVGSAVRNAEKHIRVAISTPETEELFYLGLDRLYQLLYPDSL